jgi:hypothetical protein
MGAPENVEFVPAGITQGPASRAMSVLVFAAPKREADPTPPSAPGADKTGAIEITLPNGTRLAVDASVNGKALARVLRAMKGLT